MLLVNRRSLAGLCAAGAIALAAGCGGGGDDGSALSAGEFRTQADAICQTSKDTIAALTQPTSSSTNAEVSAFLTAGLEATDAEIAKLRALEAPSDLSGTLDEALDLLEQRQERIRAATGRVAGGEDVQAVLTDANAEIDSLNGQADAKARELGLTVCGTDDDEPGRVNHLHRDDAHRPHHDGRRAVRRGDGPHPGGGRDAVGRDPGAADREQRLPRRREGGDSARRGRSSPSSTTPSPRSRATPRSDAAQERARAAVAAAGPKLSEALSRLFDALEDGDQAAAAAVVPDVQQTLQELQTALAG